VSAGVELDEAADLSGVWHGVYSYPGGSNRQPVSFVAVLTDVVGSVGGTTEEAVGKRTLTATVQGRRAGRAITFLKLYDADLRNYDTVAYDGRVSGDGEEIEGTWTVPSGWSGSFLMIRSGSLTAAVERVASERV
jgi:hypothetical protein